MRLLPASEFHLYRPKTGNTFGVFRFFAVVVCNFYFAIFSVQAQCPGSAITLTTQSEVTNFAATYPGCTVMPVGLTITGNDIVNLNGLSVLTGFENTPSLTIEDNPLLTSLAGLSNITAIPGSLKIINDDALTSLNGLNNLTSIGFSLNIENNQVLTSLAALSNVSSIGGYIDVEFNPALTTFGGGMGGVTSIGQFLQINNNPNLANLNGLNNLSTIGEYLFISSNSALTSVGGLSSLTSVGADFEISQCGSMFSFGGLTNLSNIAGSLTLSQNNSLLNLNELNNLSNIGVDLTINFNALLGNCAATGICSYIAAPNGAIGITGNAPPGCQNLVQVQTACGLLPVELISFNAVIQRDGVKLLWSTASEKDNLGYYLERSADGQNWSPIGFVTGKGTVTHRMDYSFMDEKPLSKTNYYRLMQTDTDGKYSYSNIVAVDMRDSAKPFDVFPNPSSDGIISVRAECPVEGDGHLEIYNWTGARVYDNVSQFPEGTVIYLVSLNTLPAGTYSVRLETPDGQIHYKKIVLQ